VQRSGFQELEFNFKLTSQLRTASAAMQHGVSETLFSHPSRGNLFSEGWPSTHDVDLRGGAMQKAAMLVP
jgi:hypothetical protein